MASQSAPHPRLRCIQDGPDDAVLDEDFPSHLWPWGIDWRLRGKGCSATVTDTRMKAKAEAAWSVNNGAE